MNKFESVKKAATDLQLSADTMCKMLRLLDYAKQHEVELYLADGKLRMRELSKVEPTKKTAKDAFNEDDLKDYYNQKKESKDDLFDNLKDIFNPKSFNDIFTGKK